MSGLSVVAVGAAAEAIETHVPTLVDEGFASRLFDEDATLWGPDAQAEASKRLAWTQCARTSRPLVGLIAALREETRSAGLDRVVLCGMGGSSLAPEVICATNGVALTILDSSDPDVVRETLVDLERTVVVVSSKSGSTVETDSQRRAFEAAFVDAGLDPVAHFVIVTDPGSPLEQASLAAGYRVVQADPNVGGRYSALTAFGLVPSGLAGVDVGALLDQAEEVADLLASDDAANPALRLGAAMAGTSPLRDKLVLVDAGTPNRGFGAWAEQLIAESTGKSGTGILPVVAIGPAPEKPYHDATIVRLVDDADDATPEGDSAMSVSGSLGAQFLLWEVATAVAGRLLGIDPFDQPDVESAKAAARTLLDAGMTAEAAPAFVVDGVEVRADGGDWLDGATTLDGAVRSLLTQLDPERGYVAIMAYLDRIRHADLEHVARDLFDEVDRPVTFGWGPRFLHSTGQYHKGGPATGVYVQITTTPAQDLAVPGRDFTFGQFIAAQAGGDAAVLAEHGRPVLRLHLDTPDALAAVRASLADGGA